MSKNNSSIIISAVVIAILGGYLYFSPKSGNAPVTDNLPANEENKPADTGTEPKEIDKGSIAPVVDASETKEFKAKVAAAVDKNNNGDKDGALVDYLNLLKEAPNNILILNNIANIYSDKGNWIKAEEYYKKVLAVDSGHVPTYRMLGYLYQYRFSDGEARIKELFDKGLMATNNDSRLLSWIADYYNGINQPEKALYYSKILVEQMSK
jgi:tetratricopeptide (TPR) repeat protein